MSGYDQMGRAWAEVYDQTYPALPPDDPMLDFLGRVLPKDGEILEVGVGTGRVAFPLADAGYRIAGLDASKEMLDILASKDTSSKITGKHLASMTDFDLGVKRFTGIFSVFNTINFVLSEEEQIATFDRCARHLEPDGVLAVEVVNPAQATLGYSFGRSWQPQELNDEEVTVIAGRHDATGQVIRLKHLLLTGSGTQILPADLRYLWPAELRHIIRYVGLELTGMWGDWDQSPLTDRSPRLVLVAHKSA